MSRNANPRLVFSICIFKPFFIKKQFKKLFFRFFLKNLTECYRRSKIRIWSRSLTISVIPFSERKGFIAENILNSFSAQANQNRIQRSNLKRLKIVQDFCVQLCFLGSDPNQWNIFGMPLSTNQTFWGWEFSRSDVERLEFQLIKSSAAVTLANQVLGARR
jgi:hypothetical protein